jgi:hypothetical protein
MCLVVVVCLFVLLWERTPWEHKVLLMELEKQFDLEKLMKTRARKRRAEQKRKIWQKMYIFTDTPKEQKKKKKLL